MSCAPAGASAGSVARDGPASWLHATLTSLAACCWLSDAVVLDVRVS